MLFITSDKVVNQLSDNTQLAVYDGLLSRPSLPNACSILHVYGRDHVL